MKFAALVLMIVLASSEANAAPERAARPSTPSTIHSTSFAQGAGFTVDHHTIDNGGGTAIGGTFSVRGTIGQPDADPLQPSTGGTFALTGGFWFVTSIDELFADGFEPP